MAAAQPYDETLNEDVQFLNPRRRTSSPLVLSAHQTSASISLAMRVEHFPMETSQACKRKAPNDADGRTG
jgi:hypothetical protein